MVVVCPSTTRRPLGTHPTKTDVPPLFEYCVLSVVDKEGEPFGNLAVTVLCRVLVELRSY